MPRRAAAVVTLAGGTFSYLFFFRGGANYFGPVTTIAITAGLLLALAFGVIYLVDEMGRNSSELPEAPRLGMGKKGKKE